MPTMLPMFTIITFTTIIDIRYSVVLTPCSGEAALVVALEISWLLDLASSTSRILVNIDIGNIGDIDNIGPFNLENIDSWMMETIAVPEFGTLAEENLTAKLSLYYQNDPSPFPLPLLLSLPLQFFSLCFQTWAQLPP